MLLVSHAPDVIRALCQRAILLENGDITKIGDATSVMDFYRAGLVAKMGLETSTQPKLSEFSAEIAERNSKVVLTSKTIAGVNIELIGDGAIIHTGDHLTLRVTASFDEDYADPHIGIGIRTRLGLMIYEANTYTLQQATRPVTAGDKLVINFKFHCRLAPGTYEVLVMIANKGYGRSQFEQALFYDQSFLIFEVVEGAQFSWAGVYDIQPELTLES